jgi:hypothetical protein
VIDIENQLEQIRHARSGEKFHLESLLDSFEATLYELRGMHRKYERFAVALSEAVSKVDGLKRHFLVDDDDEMGS